MRILLFTGKGGVGKSTVAAGTAALAARAGQRVLVLSTDTAHSLSDAFGVAAPAGEPVEVEPGLWFQQVDPQKRFEESWAQVQTYLLSVLDAGGVDPITAEELTVIPGAEEVLALLEVQAQARTGNWDAIVVDCAPTAETLRLLALPEALQWYMDRVFPIERRVVRTLRPVLTRATGVPMPSETVFDAIDRLHHEMGEVRDLLTGPQAAVRLVLTPETVVVAEARRTLRTLSLFGYRVDGVVANRIFPEGDDPWRAGWVCAQTQVLAEVADSFAGLTLWRSSYLPAEPVGVDALAHLARDIYGPDADPGELFGQSLGLDPVVRPQVKFEAEPGGMLMRMPLPHVSKSEVDLVRHGDDLVITIGSYRRLLTLPAAVSRMQVRGARVHAGELNVRFGTAEGTR